MNEHNSQILLAIFAVLATVATAQYYYAYPSVGYGYGYGYPSVGYGYGYGYPSAYYLKK